jgi:hypothetical protein
MKVIRNKSNISREINDRSMQSKVLFKYVSGSSTLVAASFEILNIIAQHGKPFSDGDYINGSWLEWDHFLFVGFPEKEKLFIKDLPVCIKAMKEY